jgi:anti-sigma factor RsiW
LRETEPTLEHLTPQRFKLYTQGSLSPAELLAVDEHLASCQECRQELGRSDYFKALFSSLREELGSQAELPLEHLAYEQLASYADDQADDVEREIVESHLIVCARCAEELNELTALKETLATVPSKSKSSATPAPWQRVAPWHLSARVSAFQMGSIAAVLLLLAAVGLWLALRHRNFQREERAQASNTAQPATSPPANANANTVASTVAPTKTETPAENSSRENLATASQARRGKESNPESSREVADSEIVLAINDGGRQIRLSREGRLEGLGPSEARDIRLVREALTARRLELPGELAEINARTGVLMGGESKEDSFALLSPVAAITRTTRPVFRWRPLTGAASYTVKVYDANYELVLTSPPLNATEWEPPQTLARGRRYTWQVTATKEGKTVTAPAPPAPEARFIVLAGDKLEELQRVEKTRRASHLLLGLVYARAGLLDDAEREFQILLSDNPRSAVVRKLLASVRAARRGR